jgi:GNAT superfamily N-acetyltransferase
LNKAIEIWQPNGLGIYDCWASRDLRPLGFEKIMQSPWYLRPPGPISKVDPPAGLTIEVVKTAEQLALFEEASRLGFGDRAVPDPEWEPFSQHAPATLADPAMDYLIGWLDGKVVTSVIIHATEDMLGIYGLSTLLQYRRRGYAAALIQAAVALHPELATSVHPDPPSVPIYTRIGFVAAGDLAMWRLNAQA